MARQFNERFRNLICENVPRTFLHLREGMITSGLEADLPEPDDGFVATYCQNRDAHPKLNGLQS